MNKSPTKLFSTSTLFVISLLCVSPPLFAVNDFTNDMGMSFVKIAADHFRMGIIEEERQTVIDEMNEPDFDAFLDEKPQHTVTISKAFLLGQTEVTQNQWLKVMENRPGSKDFWEHKEWENLPVVNVTWNMAQRFTEELSKMDDKYNYRLPTEAEWEFAARAGKKELRPMPVEKLNEYAWNIENSGDYAHPVASLKPNDFGVYDMLGNAWEWVADWYAPETYSNKNRIDPEGPASGRARVRRGGSYHCPLFQTRPNFRSANTPSTAYSVIGFRVVAVPE